MKKIYFFCILPLFFIMSCGGNSSAGNNNYNAPITTISGETVFDKDGNETAINGEVSYGKRKAKQIMGTIENGKLTLDLSSLEIAESNLERDEWADFPDVSIKPPETRWFFLDSFFVATGAYEEVEAMWQPLIEGEPVNMEKRPITYDLSLKATPPDVQARLVYFTNDATIKAKGTYMKIFEYDIDIKARKGWNMVYSIEAESSQTANITVSTSAKNVSEVRWIAKR